MPCKLDITRQCALCGADLLMYPVSITRMQPAWCGDTPSDEERDNDDDPRKLCRCTGKKGEVG